MSVGGDSANRSYLCEKGRGEAGVVALEVVSARKLDHFEAFTVQPRTERTGIIVGVDADEGALEPFHLGHDRQAGAVPPHPICKVKFKLRFGTRCKSSSERNTPDGIGAESVERERQDVRTHRVADHERRASCASAAGSNGSPGRDLHRSLPECALSRSTAAWRARQPGCRARQGPRRGRDQAPPTHRHRSGSLQVVASGLVGGWHFHERQIAERRRSKPPHAEWLPRSASHRRSGTAASSSSVPSIHGRHSAASRAARCRSAPRNRGCAADRTPGLDPPAIRSSVPAYSPPAGYRNPQAVNGEPRCAAGSPHTTGSASPGPARTRDSAHPRRFRPAPATAAHTREWRRSYNPRVSGSDTGAERSAPPGCVRAARTALPDKCSPDRARGASFITRRMSTPATKAPRPASARAMSMTPRFQPPSPEINSATPRGVPVGWYTVIGPSSSKSKVATSDAAGATGTGVAAG